MMQQAIPILDRKALRRFGLTTGAMFVVVFGIGFPFVLDVGFPLWPWLLLAVLGGLALVRPMSLQAVYRVWMRLAMLLNRLTSPIVLGVVFFGVVLPMGFLMRCFRRDPLARKWRQPVDSYRRPSPPASDESLRNPY